MICPTENLTLRWDRCSRSGTLTDEGIALNNEGQLGKGRRRRSAARAGMHGWDKVEIDKTAGTVYLNQACASWMSVAGLRERASRPASVQRSLIEAD